MRRVQHAACPPDAGDSVRASTHPRARDDRCEQRAAHHDEWSRIAADHLLHIVGNSPPRASRGVDRVPRSVHRVFQSPAWRELRLQGIQRALELMARVLDLALDDGRVLAKYGMSHGGFLIRTSLSRFRELTDRSGFSSSGLSFFLPASTITIPTSTTAPPTASAACHGSSHLERPSTAAASRTSSPAKR